MYLPIFASHTFQFPPELRTGPGFLPGQSNSNCRLLVIQSTSNFGICEFEKQRLFCSEIGQCQTFSAIFSPYSDNILQNHPKPQKMLSMVTCFSAHLENFPECIKLPPVRCYRYPILSGHLCSNRCFSLNIPF